MRFEPAVSSLRGDLAVPGDKSVSHRALLLGAIADGESEIRGFGRSADTLSTAGAVAALGAAVEDGGDVVRVGGVGLRGLVAPGGPVDCGNAGTLIRLLAGILAGPGRRVRARRGRVAVAAAARADRRAAATDGRATSRRPTGTRRSASRAAPLNAIRVRACRSRARRSSRACSSPGSTPSDGPTTVVEPAPSRDHTERMLAAAGARVERRPSGASRLAGRAAAARSRSTSRATSRRRRRSSPPRRCCPGSELRAARDRRQPDPDRASSTCSSAWAPGSRSTTGATAGGEPVADLEVALGRARGDRDRAARRCRCSSTSCRSSRLCAALAHGESAVRGAQELRVKESDRIESVTDALKAIGTRITSTRTMASGFEGSPPALRVGVWSSPEETIGSRCSGRSRGSSHARASRSKTPSASQ